MQFILFTNYIFKQIIIYGTQFKFTEEVIKLAVEQCDYNTSCGNNVRHDDSDHACLLSRVLKMEGANLNSIILWLWFFLVIFIMIFSILLLILSLWSVLFNCFCFGDLSQHDQEMHGWQVAWMFSHGTQKQQKLHSLLLPPFSLTKHLFVC